jgi:hypothetical protein
MKFLVRHFFMVEIEVEAKDAASAKEVAGCYETEYEITTRFVEQDGGPVIYRADMGDEVFELDDDGYVVKEAL